MATNKFIVCDALEGSSDWDDAVYIFEDEEDFKRYKNQKHILNDNDVAFSPANMSFKRCAWEDEDNDEMNDDVHSPIFIPKGGTIPYYNNPLNLRKIEHPISYAATLNVVDGEIKNVNYYLTMLNNPGNTTLSHDPHSDNFNVNQTFVLKENENYSDNIWIKVYYSVITKKKCNRVVLFRTYNTEYFKSIFEKTPMSKIAEICETTLKCMIETEYNDKIKSLVNSVSEDLENIDSLIRDFLSNLSKKN